MEEKKKQEPQDKAAAAFKRMARFFELGRYLVYSEASDEGVARYNEKTRKWEWIKTEEKEAQE